MVHEKVREFAALRDDGTYRHWAPDSEVYAPALVLMQYLRSGWKPDELVGVETFYHAGYRHSDIYYFTLQRDDASIEVPVLANPAVFKVISTHQLTVLRINIDRQEMFQDR
jgi:hypothetical protein